MPQITPSPSSLLTVTAAEHAGGHCLRLTFSNGERRLFDFLPESNVGVCRKLRDMDYFLSYTLDPFTVDWHDEIGFEPEYLYAKGAKEP